MFKNRTIYPSNLVMYIFIWTIINLFVLSVFPFMHTDEAWLSGLSRTMAEQNNPAATESFFNLVPRAPHAIKILFHFLQIILIKTAGYSLFSARLLSLLAGSAALFFFSGLLKKLSLPPLAGVLLLSLDIQYIYASHFGRQEILILLLMLISLNAFFSEKRRGFVRGVFSGLPIAIAAGVHPNAFIAAWPSGLLLLIFIITGKRRISEGLGFILTAAAGASVFVILSLLFNKGFVSDYGSFGSEVGFFDPLDVKILGFDNFYKKLFMRISGTYYTPDIIPLFAAAAAGLAAAAAGSIKKLTFPPALKAGIAGVLAVNIGIILIGKYSAPSVVFLAPFLIILICCGIETSGAARAPFLYGAAALVLLLNSSLMIYEETGGGTERHQDYIEKISAAIPPEGRTLGGLSAGFYFNEGKLLDWRNLSYLNKAELTIEEYIEENGIEYIIYTDEIDYIYNSRPVWNILYGNPVIYYEQLQDFLSQNCRLVSEFESPGYGTRLTLQRYKRDWNVRIFRVKD